MIINEMPGGAPLGPTTANADTIFNGKTAYDGEGNLITGSALSTASTAGAGQIFNGYKAYNSSGTLLTGTGLSTATSAGAGDIFTGKTAYNNSGSLITGTMANRGTITTTTSYGGSYTIPQGYHSGSGTVTGGTFDFSSATINQDVMLDGVKGYGNGGTLITGRLMKTASTATTNKILYGYTAYNHMGQYLQGTYTPQRVGFSNVSINTGTPQATLTFSVSFQPVYFLAMGTITNGNDWGGTQINYIINSVYYDGTVKNCGWGTYNGYLMGMGSTYSSNTCGVNASVTSSSITLSTKVPSDTFFTNGLAMNWFCVYWT